ncbi:hypothetical protein [Embleya sp. AB8]|uniref:hypothetical protein n=1 Tax=Embleya sp. AB8 TaxID=3156304 RepID=UPI003C728CF2
MPELRVAMQTLLGPGEDLRGVAYVKLTTGSRPDGNGAPGTVMDGKEYTEVDKRYGVRRSTALRIGLGGTVRLLLLYCTIIGAVYIESGRDEALAGEPGSIALGMPGELWLDARSSHYGPVLAVTNQRLLLVMVKDGDGGGVKVLRDIPRSFVAAATLARGDVYQRVCRVGFTDGSTITFDTLRSPARELVQSLSTV